MRETEHACVVDNPPPLAALFVALQAPGAARSCWAQPGRRSGAAGDHSNEGSTLAFAKSQARNCSPASGRTQSPACATAPYCRSGCRFGLRRAEIAALKVGVCTRTAAMTRCASCAGRKARCAGDQSADGRAIAAYLDVAGHAGDVDGPLFRPLRHTASRKR